MTNLIQQLREAAGRATKGPFFVERRDYDCGGITYIVHGGKDFAWCKDVLDRRAKFNAAYVALACPANVLKLIEAFEAQREALGKIDSICRCENAGICHVCIARRGLARADEILEGK